MARLGGVLGQDVFILLGFATGTVAGYRAALFYTIVYVLMALGSFGVILLAGRREVDRDLVAECARALADAENT